MCVYIHIYIYIYREMYTHKIHVQCYMTYGTRCSDANTCVTPSPPTKSFDFGGFDSSKLFILRGGNSRVRINL